MELFILILVLGFLSALAQQLDGMMKRRRSRSRVGRIESRVIAGNVTYTIQHKEQTGGFLYIMHSSYFPGMYKIGGTSRSPEARIKDFQTAFPGHKIDVVARVIVPETLRWQDMEKIAHSKLKTRRVGRSEWFRFESHKDAANALAKSVGGKIVQDGGGPIQFSRFWPSRLLNFLGIVFAIFLGFLVLSALVQSM